MSLGLRLRVGNLLMVAFVTLAAVLTIALGLQVMKAIQGARAAARPALSARLMPPLGWVTTRKRGSRAA